MLERGYKVLWKHCHWHHLQVFFFGVLYDVSVFACRHLLELGMLLNSCAKSFMPVPVETPVNTWMCAVSKYIHGIICPWNSLEWSVKCRYCVIDLIFVYITLCYYIFIAPYCSMSAIDFYCSVDKVQGADGKDRVVVTFDGKYLPYTEQVSVLFLLFACHSVPDKLMALSIPIKNSSR